MVNFQVMSYNESYTKGVINIKEGNYLQKCKSSCRLNLDFESNLSFTIKNKGEVITIYPTTNSNTKFIKYNDVKYTFTEINFYRKSWHTYGDKVQTDGELIISAYSKSGGNPTMVMISIPITRGASSTGATSQLKSIIDYMFMNTPNRNNTAKTTKKYDLNQMAPVKAPFYTYNMSNTTQMIVYLPESSIKLDQATINKYNSILKMHNKPIYEYSYSDKTKQMPIFYNSSGAGSTDQPSGNDDDIYIECKPTGKEGKKVTLEDKMDPTAISSEAKNIMMFILKFIAAVIAIKIIWSLPKFFSKRPKPPDPPAKPSSAKSSSTS